MKKKKVIISITAGLLSMIIATSFASAKFRGGSVIDVARVAKETQKVVEETKILPYLSLRNNNAARSAGRIFWIH